MHLYLSIDVPFFFFLITGRFCYLGGGQRTVLVCVTMGPAVSRRCIIHRSLNRSTNSACILPRADKYGFITDHLDRHVSYLDAYYVGNSGLGPFNCTFPSLRSHLG